MISFEEIKNHSFFNNLDWDQVLKKKLTPPIIPEIKHIDDTGNFDPVKIQHFLAKLH